MAKRCALCEEPGFRKTNLKAQAVVSGDLLDSDPSSRRGSAPRGHVAPPAPFFGRAVETRFLFAYPQGAQRVEGQLNSQAPDFEEDLRVCLSRLAALHCDRQ